MRQVFATIGIFAERTNLPEPLWEECEALLERKEYELAARMQNVTLGFPTQGQAEFVQISFDELRMLAPNTYSFLERCIDEAIKFAVMSEQ